MAQYRDIPMLPCVLCSREVGAVGGHNTHGCDGRSYAYCGCGPLLTDDVWARIRAVPEEQRQRAEVPDWAGGSKQSGQSGEGLWQEAVRLIKVGDMAGALGVLERLVEAEPTNVLYQHNRAAVLLELGRSDDAAAGFALVLEMEPNHEKARLGLDLAKGPDRPVSRPTGKAEDLNAEVAAALADIPASVLETREFSDYPVLVACSEDTPVLEMPEEAARRHAREVEALIRAEPDLDLAYFWLAICQNSLDEFPAAVRTVLEGLRKSKYKGNLCAILAEICLSREHLEMTLRASIAAVHLGSELYLAHHIVATLLDFYDMAAAARDLRASVPTEIESWLSDKIRALAKRQGSDVTRQLVEEYASGGTG